MAYPLLSSGSDLTSLVSQLNTIISQINNDQLTKTFKQSISKNAIVEGKLPYDGGYGALYYDSDGIPIVVIGILPDGTTGLAIAKPGNSVLDAFS